MLVSVELRQSVAKRIIGDGAQKRIGKSPSGAGFQPVGVILAHLFWRLEADRRTPTLPIRGTRVCTDAVDCRLHIESCATQQ